MKPEIMNFFSMCWVSSCSRVQNSLWENWEHCALEMKEHTKGWLLFCWGTYKDHRLIFLSLFSWCGTELSTALQWLPGVSYAICAKYSSCALLTGFFACEIRINFSWFSEIPFIMELWIFGVNFLSSPLFRAQEQWHEPSHLQWLWAGRVQNSCWLFSQSSWAIAYFWILWTLC